MNFSLTPGTVPRILLLGGPKDSMKKDACDRCGGLLVTETAIDLRNECYEFEIPIFRCVQCGNVLDVVILENRKGPDGGGTRSRPHLRRRWTPAASVLPRKSGEIRD